MEGGGRGGNNEILADVTSYASQVIDRKRVKVNMAIDGCAWHGMVTWGAVSQMPHE